MHCAWICLICGDRNLAANWVEQHAEQFRRTEVYQQLQEQYPYLLFEYRDRFVPFHSDYEGLSHRVGDLRRGIMYYSGFVYLQLLLETNPTTIADIGCGANFYKQYYPNIIGFDATPEADSPEMFKPVFVDKHLNEFDCAFSICSLHFIPLQKLTERIVEFSKIIKPGGRGFISFNLQRMIERSDFKLDTPAEYARYIDNCVKALPLDIIVYDNVIEQSALRNKQYWYDVHKGADWPEKLGDPASAEITAEMTELGFFNETHSEWLEETQQGSFRIVFEKG